MRNWWNLPATQRHDAPCLFGIPLVQTTESNFTELSRHMNRNAHGRALLSLKRDDDDTPANIGNGCLVNIGRGHKRTSHFAALSFGRFSPAVSLNNQAECSLKNLGDCAGRVNS